MDADKPTIIFTTFWEGEKIRENKGFCVDDKIYQFERKDCQILSVALAQPPSFKHRNLEFLNPSWDILKAYKGKRDWDLYTKQYKAILIQNKNDIVEWMDTLEGGKVYILCCWENTCKGANCHRKIVHDALNGSAKTKGKANYIYRHGDNTAGQKEKDILGMLRDESKSKKLLSSSTTSSADLYHLNVGSMSYGCELYARGYHQGIYCLNVLALASRGEDAVQRFSGSVMSNSSAVILRKPNGSHLLVSPYRESGEALRFQMREGVFAVFMRVIGEVVDANREGDEWDVYDEDHNRLDNMVAPHPTYNLRDILMAMDDRDRAEDESGPDDSPLYDDENYDDNDPLARAFEDLEADF